jgi:hypothetical protein
MAGGGSAVAGYPSVNPAMRAAANAFNNPRPTQPFDPRLPIDERLGIQPLLHRFYAGARL